MLEQLLGGGRGSPPPSNSGTPQPTTSPASPSASGPTTDASKPVESSEPAEDDMPINHDDGTYSPAPVTDTSEAVDVGAENPAAEPAAPEPPASDANNETEAPAPVATAPPDNDDADEGAASDTPSPQVPGAIPQAQQPPVAGAAQLPGITDDVAVVAASSTTKIDALTRVTDLIARYETLLSEPPSKDDEPARIRAMELAQNRALTSLLAEMSTSDAHRALLEDRGDPSEPASLVDKYYAEAGR